MKGNLMTKTAAAGYLDISDCSILAVCRKCEARSHVATHAAGWTWLAVHLKSSHGDIHAVKRAYAASRAARFRAARKGE